MRPARRGSSSGQAPRTASKEGISRGLVGPNGPQATMRDLSITKGFLEGMRDLGYIEGDNVHYELRSAEGKVAERMGSITEELVAKGVDLIVVLGTSTT